MLCSNAGWRGQGHGALGTCGGPTLAWVRVGRDEVTFGILPIGQFIRAPKAVVKTFDFTIQIDRKVTLSIPLPLGRRAHFVQLCVLLKKLTQKISRKVDSIALGAE